MIWASVGVCLLVPALLLVWLRAARPQSRLYLVTLIVLVASTVTAFGLSVLATGYVAVGAYWPWVFAAVLLVGVARQVRLGVPHAWLPRAWSRQFFVTAIGIGLALLPAPVLFHLVFARSYEGQPMTLASPLRGSGFHVMGGGANGAVNHHALFDLPEQRYALDILRLDGRGTRATAVAPVDLNAYHAFGAEVVSPCDGVVIAAADGLPDRPPADPDPAHRHGNHVVIFCQGSSVLLAHLQSGTVGVRVGQLVRTGDPLGRVGNSGMTFEPHLHLHAVEGRQADASGRAVPVLIDGEFLIRGDSFSN